MKKYLSFYYKCMESGKMPDAGLCACFPNSKPLDLFHPDNEEQNQLIRENLSFWYWGSGMKYDNPDRLSTFTPLRQTIVLFMAAMNNEL